MHRACRCHWVIRCPCSCSLAFGLHFRRAMTAARARRDPVNGAWLGHGAIGGLLGGAALMVVEILLASAVMGVGWALLPVRFAAGILLGSGAVDPGSPAGPVALAGVLVHLTLSGGFGALFAAIVDGRPRGALTMLPAALAYGAGLWLVNVYVIAPYAGWDWFPQRTTPVQLFTHALVFAPIVAVSLARVESRGRSVVVDTTEPGALRRAA